MDDTNELLRNKKKVIAVKTHRRPEGSAGKTFVTSDHEVIQQWAEHRQALPATGERTESGPATVNVNDSGAGIRFNFPGAALFRQIAWNEWFENFDGHDLVFVYEEHMADGNVSTRYRLVKSEEIERNVL